VLQLSPVQAQTQEQAQTPPQPTEEQKAVDKQLYESLRRVINTGADLYNRDNDRAGCYHLYQGSLLTLRPLLDHHTNLREEADKALAAAEQHSNMGERAHILRNALGTIRDGLKPEKAAAPVVNATEPKPSTPSTPGTTPAKPAETSGAAAAPPKPAETSGAAAAPPKPKTESTATPAGHATLWDRLGGETGVRKVVSDFVTLAAADPKVNFDRGARYKLEAASVDHLKKELVNFISQATSGPIPYAGKSMKEVHKGMKITDKEFDALAADLRKVLEQNGVKPEDVKAVLDAVEGTRKDIVEPETNK
jgi:hemoglobin